MPLGNLLRRCDFDHHLLRCWVFGVKEDVSMAYGSTFVWMKDVFENEMYEGEEAEGR